jgi:hypothetical protein
MIDDGFSAFLISLYSLLCFYAGIQSILLLFCHRFLVVDFSGKSALAMLLFTFVDFGVI